MFTLPLYSLLILYAVFLIVFAVFMSINFFHLNHTASLTPASIAMTIVVILLALGVLAGSVALFTGVDWREPLFQINSNPFGSFGP